LNENPVKRREFIPTLRMGSDGVVHKTIRETAKEAPRL
jgi:hypothetical protein